MKYSVLVTAIVVAALTGCGGDSGGSDSTGITINESLKGQATAPELTDVTSGSVSLNSLVKGSLEDGGEDVWTFTAEVDGEVMLVLSSSASDFDLSVNGNTVSEEGDGAGSDETIFFTATAGSSYQLTVSSYEGAGAYELAVTVPNRESAGLTGDEYLVRYHADVESDCDGSSEDYSYTYYVTANWSKGYLYYSGDKESFDDVDGTTVTVEYSDSGVGYSMSGTVIFTVNTETGAVTGTDNWNEEINYGGGDIDSCVYQEVITGQIIL